MGRRWRTSRAGLQVSPRAPRSSRVPVATSTRVPDRERRTRYTIPSRSLCLPRPPRSSIASTSDTQATTAANNADAFVLCVVPLENRNPTIDLVVGSGKFVTDIGAALKTKIAEVTDFESKKAIAATASGGIEVFITGAEVRYQILESIWALGKSVPEFIQYLVAFFSTEDAVGAP